MHSADQNIFSPERRAAWQEDRHNDLCRGHGGKPPEVLEGNGFLYRPRQILVEATNPTAVKFVTEELTRRGGEIDRKSVAGFKAAGLPLIAFLLPHDVNLPALVTELRRPRGDMPVPNVAVNHVLSGEPNYHGGPAGEPLSAEPFGEPAFDGADLAPTVAVLDTGYDPEVQQLHPGLVPRVEFAPGDVENPVLPSGFLAAEGGHGSFVDGIIMQLAPQARIRQVMVLDPAGVGDDMTVALALAAAARAGAEIINLSLGGYTQDDAPPPATSAALAQLPDTVAVVAAAGNDGNTRVFWPAASERVIGVGALDTSDPDQPPSLATFSNSGPWVKVYAPGVRILSTYLEDTWKLPSDPQPRPMDGYAYWSGTSFAAPQVAALIANATQQAGSARLAADQILGQAPQDPGLGPILVPDPGVVGLPAVAEAH